MGTKTDLRDDKNTVDALKKHKEKTKTKEDGFDLKWEIKAKRYLECSSLKREGIKEVFDEVIRTGLQFKREKGQQGRKKRNSKYSKCTFL